jgi:hypothetical protein
MGLEEVRSVRGVRACEVRITGMLEEIIHHLRQITSLDTRAFFPNVNRGIKGTKNCILLRAQGLIPKLIATSAAKSWSETAGDANRAGE